MNTISNDGFQLHNRHFVLPRHRVVRTTFSMRCWIFCQRLIAMLALCILSPLIFVMWALVKGTSKGPFLFTQERPGIEGKTFKIFKVRTMQVGSEKATALGVQNNSPQVTSIGRILRTLKLDELPQLWNVACGDMALVGPRPIPSKLNEELCEKIPGFSRRYQIRPGLTSIGQICVNDNALDDKLVEDWKIRFEGELHYMRHRSVLYDFVMIAMTSLYVFKKFLEK
ncbi:sugar transferase [Puniceicoccus vermicola]|uniref:Sugar transferase n=1 Tax=Puniceicoccus vermicola TaxID=388746 RepID=A0A7X1E749_9BACT|nr:sugar transferase [Puniceicoccus vermicola]MBC2603337.1 sugar transferase [Puniceicoccus vermicola]